MRDARAISERVIDGVGKRPSLAVALFVSFSTGSGIEGTASAQALGRQGKPV
jgi:hypothetical protein